MDPRLVEYKIVNKQLVEDLGMEKRHETSSCQNICSATEYVQSFLVRKVLSDRAGFLEKEEKQKKALFYEKFSAGAESTDKKMRGGDVVFL
uniref:FBD domain-containing protein n=1 Tax=Steinernema glaseri TaxID=37863 RepID=A0A1I7Y134_9BILA